jgi:hypothetical protein
MRLAILEWAIPMALGHHARSGPDLTAHQSKAGVGGGVHRDHRVHRHTISIPMLHRAEAAPTLRRRRELDLGRVPGLRRGRLSIASTCRPARAAPVRSDQPSTIFGAVTFALAKNRPARSSPGRLPPSRRKHTVLRATICSRIAPPLIEAQITECPQRHLHGGSCRSVAAGQGIVLAPRRANEKCSDGPDVP